MVKIIAVYGSARLALDNPVYQQSYQMGNALAQAGYTVMTGGYDGVMGAVSQGAAEAKGHVIGITVQRSGQGAERKTNRWVKEEIQYPSMRERLHHLVEHADGYIAMPGGIGTLQEITEAWQLMRIKKIPRRPLVLYGDFWQPVLIRFMDSDYVSSAELDLIRICNTPDDIIAYLAAWKG